MAPLTDVSKNELPFVVRQMEARVEAESPAVDKEMFWSTTMLLIGLKYEDTFIMELLKGVIDMKEASTYQYILREGCEQGREEEARRIVLLQASKRFGEPDAQTQATRNALASQEQIALRMFEAKSCQELLQ